MEVITYNFYEKNILVEGLKIYNKMYCTMPFTFKIIAFFTATVDGKPWTLARELCRTLGYRSGKRVDTSLLLVLLLSVFVNFIMKKA